MSVASYYPAGACYDSRAPWNETSDLTEQTDEPRYSIPNDKWEECIKTLNDIPTVEDWYRMKAKRG